MSDRPVDHFRRYFDAPPIPGLPSGQKLVSVALAGLAIRIEDVLDRYQAAWNDCHAQTNADGLRSALLRFAAIEVVYEEAERDFAEASKAARAVGYATLGSWKSYRNPSLYPNREPSGAASHNSACAGLTA